MIRLLKCEFQKIRGRYIFLTALIITAAQLVWSLHGQYDGFMLENGWLAFLYQLPLANAIFFPVLSIIISSRICDTEHKGGMLKQLATVSDRGAIYDSKLVFGLIIVLLMNLINWSVTIAFGYFVGFGGSVPIKLYLIYLLFTVLPTIVIYIFQHSLSLIFKNQAVTFFAGIIGTFIGLFAMFLPQIPAIRHIFIWGYYGCLQFVGLFGWTKETRYDYAYFEIMRTEPASVVILVVFGIIIYIAGKKIFCKKEL